ncbi:DUF726 domain-containing protein [Vibrio furnissii]|uniref:DUF726 domain-containing protein n=1 Tax=Vibrio furnissii TaxID=29494 RepID=UPI002572D9DE|nr:DUF726 domain-containing protein [Vibrio furnissii]WJG24390.1 DUF726 domain-containing protein [Vibrio furnissii]
MSNRSRVGVQWCSWCFKRAPHQLIEKNYLSRNEYQCLECLNFTVQCRYCSNMATFKPYKPQIDSESLAANAISLSVVGKFASFNPTRKLKQVKDEWASECCAEHDGTIASFQSLSKRLDDLSDFKKLFDDKKINIAAGGKILGGMVAGVAVFGPLSYIAAPAIASSLGSLGLLGAASTGTAISTLSGAALTSASLAALGPGGMAGGVAFVSAIGAALGGTKGAVVSNSYFGSIKDFNILKVRDGVGPAVIFINGFLSQKNQDASDWLEGIKDKYPNNPCYLVTWESSVLYELGTLIGNEAGKKSIEKYLTYCAKKASKKNAAKAGPLGWASFLTDLIDNPWHVAMAKSSMTGILLADIIARTNNKDGFILMGHSLGSRVIYYCLGALSTKSEALINDVHLFGGAIDGSEKSDWDSKKSAVKGTINNYYSKHDNVLKYLFKSANIGLGGRPIGLGNVICSDSNNYDVSDNVSGHMVYKSNLPKYININEK